MRKVKSEAQIARARIPGLVKLIVATMNRALKLEVEKGQEAAAGAWSQVERYRVVAVEVEQLAMKVRRDGAIRRAEEVERLAGVLLPSGEGGAACLA
jgi:hypothetical protein